MPVGRLIGEPEGMFLTRLRRSAVLGVAAVALAAGFASTAEASQSVLPTCALDAPQEGRPVLHSDIDGSWIGFELRYKCRETQASYLHAHLVADPDSQGGTIVGTASSWADGAKTRLSTEPFVVGTSTRYCDSTEPDRYAVEYDVIDIHAAGGQASPKYRQTDVVTLACTFR